VRTHLDARRAGRGAAAGLLSGAVAVGAGQAVAGVTGANGSPVVAVGQLQIDLSPPALKNFAISAFGSHDKQVLVGGILVVLALFAAALGILAMRRLGYGLAGLTVFAVIGVVAAATRPGATAADVLPTLAAAAAGAATMVILIRTARGMASAREGAPGGPPEPGRRRFLVVSAAAAGAAAAGVLAGRALAGGSSVASARALPTWRFRA
jgi:hypothetical protein